MAVIGDFGGTSNKSFSIDGKITLFVGDDIPDDLMGNNGDVYFKQEGLIYVKRNGTWLTNDPEDIKWIPDPRTNQNRLLYSNGESYDTTEIVYNANSEQPHQMELYTEPNTDKGTTSMIVPNIGWINKSDKNNLLHKTDNEIKIGRLTLEQSEFPLLLRNPNQNRENQGSTEIMNELSFCDKNNKHISTIASIVNSKKYKNIYNTISELRLRTYNKFYTGIDDNNEPLDLAQIRLVLGRKNDQNIAFATAPTPLDDASNDEIVTAEWVKKNISGKKLGEIIWSPIPLNDNGLLLMNGQRIEYTIYPDFYNLINSIYSNSQGTNIVLSTTSTSVLRPSTNLGKFYINTTKKYVWLPDYSNIVNLQPTTSASELGQYLEAGLPNITGFAQSFSKNSGYNGALYFNNNSSSTINHGGDWDDWNKNLNFDASRSSNIYGKSDTVQPESIKTYVYVVVSTNIAGDTGSLDINSLINQINEYKNIVNQLQVTINELNNNISSKLSYIDYSKSPIDITSTSGTIQNDGWIVYNFVRTTSGFPTSYLRINGINMLVIDADQDGINTSNGIIPVKRGDTWSIDRTDGSSIRFFYKT